MQKRKELNVDVMEHRGNKLIGLERILKIADDYEETAGDMRKHAVDEDSEQEYHTVDEHGYLRDRLSFEQTETLNISNLEVVGLRNSGCEVKCASSPEMNLVNLESSSSISSDSVDVCGQEDSPHVSEFQNAIMLREHLEPQHEERKEQETSLMYHTASDETVLSSLPENQEYRSKTGLLNPQKALNTEIQTGKMKPQVTEMKDFCGDAIVENKTFHFEGPSTLPQDKDLETLPQPYKDCQTSWTSIFDDSVISSCGSSHYKSLQNTSNSALDFSAAMPRSVVTDQAMQEDSSLKVADASATNKTCFYNVEGTSSEAVAGTVRVNQAVDVCADFRACFTASRATSAQSPVASTSSNTEITMMSKKRPAEWPRERLRTVACNTDWSYGQDHAGAQMTMPEGSLGRPLSVDSFTPNEHFLNKDPLELRETFAVADLKVHPERDPRLSKEMEKNLPPECCQNIMQRATKAELYLLNAQYQMCHRHCSDIHKLVMENREELNMNLSSHSTKKELGSALLSVLGDLKFRYMNLKEKIKKGIALEELPPLSVESKLLSTFSAFASRLMKKPHVFSGGGSELNQSARDVDVSLSLKTTLPQMSLPSDASHPKQGLLPKEGGFKNDGIDVHFSQLKLDDKDCRNPREVSEDWFDAKEDLAGADFSAGRDGHVELGGGDPKASLERESAEPPRRDKGYVVHVGGLCPSVSEADLRSYFQKYQVSEISIYDSSTNYRYASLVFKKNNDAKMAVKEMNGVEVHGKSVNVRLVKAPGECPSPLSSKNGSRVGLNNLEKRTSKEIHSAASISRWPRTRPRQLGSEQDSEFFHFHQYVKKNCKQIESAKLLPDAPVQLMPADTLNLRSFTKIIKKLAELHPEVSRDHIIDALQEVRINHKGSLNGLSINTIVEMTSSVLKNSASS